jgi:uncharacterized membrane protein
MEPFAETLWPAIHARRRLFIGVIAGIVVFLLVRGVSLLSRGLIAWDGGCLIFLALWAVEFSTASTSDMPENAAAQEDGEWTIFWITVAGVIASFGAIIGEFSAIPTGGGEAKLLRVILVGATLFLSWLLTHTVFALRYAHEFYESSGPGRPFRGGLEFPGDREPDYWDFFYFALVLGMTFQVSDVQITDHRLRRLAAAHGLLGFLFNAVILALTVNVSAGLLQPPSGSG